MDVELESVGVMSYKEFDRLLSMLKSEPGYHVVATYRSDAPSDFYITNHGETVHE